MHKPSTMVIAIFAIASCSAPATAQSLPEQLDVVAPLVNAESLDALGGPDNPESIVASIDGRWFTLNNTTRNWGEAGVGFGPDDLENSRLRLCADDADESSVHEVTGPTSFDVHETIGYYDVSLTQTVTWRDGRRFDILIDKGDYLRSYGIEADDDARREEMLGYLEILIEEGVEIWRPSEDILVLDGTFGTNVIGRC